MGNKEFQFLRVAMSLTDLVLLNCSAMIAILLNFYGTDAISPFLILIAVNASWLIIAYFLKLYTYSSIAFSEKDLPSILACMATASHFALYSILFFFFFFCCKSCYFKLCMYIGYFDLHQPFFPDISR